MTVCQNRYLSAHDRSDQGNKPVGAEVLLRDAIINGSCRRSPKPIVWIETRGTGPESKSSTRFTFRKCAATSTLVSPSNKRKIASGSISIARSNASLGARPPRILIPSIHAAARRRFREWHRQGISRALGSQAKQLNFVAEKIDVETLRWLQGRNRTKQLAFRGVEGSIFSHAPRAIDDEAKRIAGRFGAEELSRSSTSPR